MTISAVLPAALAVHEVALVKKPRRASPSRLFAFLSASPSGNSDARETIAGAPCACIRLFAEAMVSSTPGEVSLNLHVLQQPSTNTMSLAPTAAKPSSRLSSTRARQGASANLCGSARPFDAMRAQAMTARPSREAMASAAACSSASSAGRTGIKASVGQTTVQAPHATQALWSTLSTLLCTLMASAGQASMHLRHEALRFRTATQRFEAGTTALSSSSSATSMMSAMFGIRLPPRLLPRIYAAAKISA